MLYVTLVMHERISIIKKRKGSVNEEKLRILSLDVFCERDDSMNTFLFLILTIFEFLRSNYNLISSNEQTSNILTEKSNESTNIFFKLKEILSGLFFFNTIKPKVTDATEWIQVKFNPETRTSKETINSYINSGHYFSF